MSDDVSPRLALPFLLPAQAQKHVTHNEALRRLDILVQLVVEAFDALIPPALPAEGAVYALGAGATGDWAGQDGRLAAFLDGSWQFLVPAEGWRAWGRDEGRLRVRRGGTWREPALDGLAGLGIGTAHDATNRLAVAAPGALFSHAGSDHRLTVNKAAAGDTASLLFQSGWSGRAEIGLAGGEDLSVKVSADGSSFTQALAINRSTGAAAMAAGLTVGGQAALHRGQILGPVSQSGGSPTGAVMECGSNANGDYVRFADGTQIVTRTMTGLGPIASVYGSGFRSAAILVGPLAAAFAAPPLRSVMSQGAGAAASAVEGAGQTSATSGGTFFLTRLTASTATDFTAHLVFTGRWF